MKCENCNHEQESGKFCGKCGNSLIGKMPANAGTSFFQPSDNTQTVNPTHSTTTVPPYQTSVDPNLHVEKVKETSKQYWGYFLAHFKKPSTIFIEFEKNFLNALITFAIFAIITALAVNNIIGFLIGPVDEYSSFLAEESLKPSFIQILFYVAISLAVVYALSIVSLYVVSKFFGPQTPFKPLITIFGTYLVPLNLVILTAYLLLLIDSRGIGTSLFVIGILFSIFIMPLFLITSLVIKKPHQVDSFYAFAAYIILFMIGLSIVLSVFVDSSLTSLLSDIEDLFDPYSY